ncbi:MAG: glycosyltransferase [Candidatus Syntrophopropionicum ammoniitolerans]
MWSILTRLCSLAYRSPPELQTLQGPVVGYVGAISAWFDQEMLAAAAHAHPEWSFVLVGPVDTDVSLLDSLPNVRLTGHKPYSVLPAYLKGFDVTVIPFKINALTTGVNPVKLYEYLAAGRPIVSSDLPEVRAFRPSSSDSRQWNRVCAEIRAGIGCRHTGEKGGTAGGGREAFLAGQGGVCGSCGGEV